MNFIDEIFYKEYFGLKGILGGGFDEKKFFSLLSDIYCIEAKESKKLFEDTHKEIVAEILSLEEYSRYKRIKEYVAMQGNPPLADRDTEDLITIKGEAFKAIAKYELNIAPDATKGQIAATLSERAYSGNVIALRTIGILECEGVKGYGAGKGKGLEHLTKAARWNDLTSALALLYYDESHRAENARILAAVLCHTPFGELAAKAEQRYGVSLASPSPEVLVIKKAIAHGKVNPLNYDASVGRILFCRAISLEDKKRVLYAGNPSLIAEVCELPLGLRFGTLTFDEQALERAPYDLSGIKEQVTTNLMNADLRDKALYLPLVLSTDSDYGTDMAVGVVRSLFADAKVIRVDAKTIKPRDLVRTKNNVFLRDLSRDKNNVMLLVLEGRIDDAVIEEIVDFLRGETRADFNLETPSLSIDLSGVLPICVCDRENARRLAEEAEVVELPPFAKQKSACVIRAIFEERKQAYGLDRLSIEEEALALIATLAIDSAESVIDKMLRSCRAKRTESAVTAEAVREAMNGMRANAFGFGGGKL